MAESITRKTKENRNLKKSNDCIQLSRKKLYGSCIGEKFSKKISTEFQKKILCVIICHKS